MLISRKFFTGITLAVAIFALSTFVSAQETTKEDAPVVKEGRHKRGGKANREHFGEKEARGKHGGMMGRSFRGLELTDAQKTQIKSLMEVNKASFQANREELKSLRMKKRDGSLTEADQARLEQFKSQFKASKEQTKMTIMGLLTPEQTAKLIERKAERETRMQEHKQRRTERKLKTDAPKDNK